MRNVCILCGNPKGRNKYFCSMKCSSAYRKHLKICPVCGNQFADSPSNTTVCCSPKCSKMHRIDLHKSGAYNDSISRMLSEKDKFWSCHTGANHINAKHWILLSPDGKIYECQNLQNFIRGNPDLFDGTLKQAYDGIIKIKASMQGKRKNPCFTWKGWKLIDWNDQKNSRD